MKRHLLWIPTAACFITVALTIWDMYNQRVIVSMGMGWDTGPPTSPYETPAILLWSLNFPARLVSQPIANALRLCCSRSHLLTFPATIAWWRFVGTRLQRGSAAFNRPQRRFVRAAFLILALALWSATLYGFMEALKWWNQYGDLSADDALRMVGYIGPAVWGILFGAVAACTAIRRDETS